MSFERVLLALLAAFVLIAGVGCLIAPSSFAEQAQLGTAPGALGAHRLDIDLVPGDAHPGSDLESLCVGIHDSRYLGTRRQ